MSGHMTAASETTLPPEERPEPSPDPIPGLPPKEPDPGRGPATPPRDPDPDKQYPDPGNPPDPWGPDPVVPPLDRPDSFVMTEPIDGRREL